MDEQVGERVTALQEEALEETDPHKSAALLREALKLDPGSVSTLAWLANVLMLKVHDPAGVVDALASAPGHSDLSYFRGSALQELGRDDEAWAELDRSAAIFDPGASPLIGIGQILSIHALLVGDFERSLPLAERAVARDPLFGMCWHFFGYFLFMSGDRELATRALAVCASVEPERVEEIQEDDDFGPFREDPRFTAALETAPLDESGRAALARTYAGLEGLGAAELRAALRARLEA